MSANRRDQGQPIDADRHIRNASEYEEQGDYERALEECDAAIAVAQPFLADAYNLRGLIMEGLARPEEAISAYKQAILLEPGFRVAADNLRLIESDLGIDHGLVTIVVYEQVVQALAAQAELETEGILSFLADETAVGAIGLGAGLLGGARLQVGEPDVERALEILGIEAEGSDDLRCPSCDSSNIRLPLLGNSCRCEACGHRWTL